MRLEDVMPGHRICGVSEQPIEIVSTNWLGGDYLHVVFRDIAGKVDDRLLDRADEADLGLDEPQRSSVFGGDAVVWKEATEALRLRYAALLDPMLAVSHSTLQPLPHQIKAVYGEFLPRTPLRYLLADDPGAGKTIMCGLYVKEMILRGELDRCLIVAPGGLVDQWQDELWTKFGLQFRIVSRDLIASTTSGSVFGEFPLLIARMDMLARDEELQEQLDRSEWDLVVVDEAHRMSARWNGEELEATKRYLLGRQLGKLTRNLLLMTATPHSGDPAAFQAFLALLDEDRFVRGLRRDHVPPPGTDVMRRMLKEELLTMDGKPLFPERFASTVNYELSTHERHLYEQVSDYVRNEMNRAKRLGAEGERKRANTVGFALTVLQRRLASSPEAILRSLERRKARLQKLCDELESLQTGAANLPSEVDRVALPDDLDDGWADRDAATEESVEETLVDAASAARTRAELAVEIAAVGALVVVAAEVRARDTDSKWMELRSILQDNELTRDQQGQPRKIIIFSEHRDTLRYLSERIRSLPGRASSVVEIHGGLSRDERLSVQRRFTEEPGVSVLVATDAAGEGLNLQCAHLMVNYDLPWNPNRIEQRFGRIHRIGQTEVCHLWNLVASNTREGDVFLRLLTKMAEQARAYQGKVFDVLGEAFDETPLRELLVEAILRGDDPDVRARLHTVIDSTVSEGIPELVQRRARYGEVLHQVDVQMAQEKADLGLRLKLQPYFTASWFDSTFKRLGGRMRKRAEGLAEIMVVPEMVIAGARAGTGSALSNRYEYVTFDPERARTREHSGGAQVLGPGHPLLDAVANATELRGRDELRVGAILVDPHDPGDEPRLFAAIVHEIHSGRVDDPSLSKSVAFVEIDGSGQGHDVGPAYLDYRPATESEQGRIRAGLEHRLSSVDPEKMAADWAIRELVPGHLAHVRSTHGEAVARARAEIIERMEGEVLFWRSQGSGTSKSTPEQVQRRIERLQSRLQTRLAELDSEARIVPRPPHTLAVALVVPAGVLGLQLSGPAAPGEVEIEAVVDAERRLGRTVRVTGTPLRPALRSSTPNGLSVWIDVRCYDPGERQMALTRTEVLHARNLAGRHRLALVGPAALGHGPEVRYVPDPLVRLRIDDFHEHQFHFSLGPLWRAGAAPF